MIILLRYYVRLVNHFKELLVAVWAQAAQDGMIMSRNINKYHMKHFSYGGIMGSPGMGLSMNFEEEHMLGTSTVLGI